MQWMLGLYQSVTFGFFTPGKYFCGFIFIPMSGYFLAFLVKKFDLLILLPSIPIWGFQLSFYRWFFHKKLKSVRHEIHMNYTVYMVWLNCFSLFKTVWQMPLIIHIWEQIFFLLFYFEVLETASLGNLPLRKNEKLIVCIYKDNDEIVPSIYV